MVVVSVAKVPSVVLEVAVEMVAVLVVILVVSVVPKSSSVTEMEKLEEL